MLLENVHFGSRRSSFLEYDGLETRLTVIELDREYNIAVSQATPFTVSIRTSSFPALAIALRGWCLCARVCGSNHVIRICPLYTVTSLARSYVDVRTSSVLAT